MNMKTINRTARLTGLLYFIQVPLAIFGVMYAPMALIVQGDALATMNNFASSASVFRMSIGAALLVQVSHLFIAILLYKILSPAGKTAGVIMVVLMAVSVPIAMLNESLNWNAYVGCSLILIGVMVVNNIIRFPGKTVNV